VTQGMLKIYFLLLTKSYFVFQACISFITMQLQLCSVFFTFSLGTRAHYFGKTILHGGAKVCFLLHTKLLNLDIIVIPLIERLAVSSNWKRVRGEAH
jgi:hypothetical protein